MANKVFANSREINCKSGSGKSICAFPDVCWTPPDKVPPTPTGVPVPYPNTGMASDCAKGSKKVKISGKEVLLKNSSHFKKSSGDEAGAAQLKGLITAKNRGKVYFQMWSMNVKIEGKNVVRHMDIGTHNHGSMPGNTPPWPFIDSMAVQAPKVDKNRKGHIKVTVTDVCTGDAVPDCEVIIKTAKKTSSSGEAEFKNLVVADYSVLVKKHFTDCDYVTFILHYPAVTISHKAIEKTNMLGTVKDGQTTNISIPIEVYRLVPDMVFHRRHLDPGGADKYGHWWVVLGDGTSYGWWPKFGLGDANNRSSIPPVPPKALSAGASRLSKIQHMFDTSVYKAKKAAYDLYEHSMSRTLRGVDGELNGQTSFGGSATVDPHAVYDEGNEQYQPVTHDCRTDQEIRACMTKFATSYSGEWSWRLEFGKHCHSFQKEMMAHCKTEQVKKLK